MQTQLCNFAPSLTKTKLSIHTKTTNYLFTVYYAGKLLTVNVNFKIELN